MQMMTMTYPTTNNNNNKFNNNGFSTCGASMFSYTDSEMSDIPCTSSIISSNHKHAVPKTIAEYTVVEELAEGAFGTIFKVRDPTMNNTHYVIKKIPLSKLKPAELTAAQQLPQHPNIIRFHKYYQDSESAYLVLEFIDGDDMFSVMERRNFHPLKENYARAVFRGIVKALYNTHMVGIAHRDLKLENVMLDRISRRIVLIDFGLCDLVGGGYTGKEEASSTGCVGSPEYLAPELLHPRPYNAKKADIWSLGVVLFFLLTGNFPFDVHRRIQALMDNEPIAPFHLEFPPELQGVSVELKDLLQRMLVDKPEHRLNIEDILRHPWLKKQSASSASPCSFAFCASSIPCSSSAPISFSVASSSHVSFASPFSTPISSPCSSAPSSPAHVPTYAEHYNSTVTGDFSSLPSAAPTATTAPATISNDHTNNNNNNYNNSQQPTNTYSNIDNYCPARELLLGS